MQNENEIAANLKTNIPEGYTSPEPTPVEPTAPGASALDSSVALDNPLLMSQVVQQLGLPPNASLNPKTNDALKAVIKFATAEAVSGDPEAILSVLNRYELALGTTYHPDRFQKLYTFIRTRTYLNEVGL